MGKNITLVGGNGDGQTCKVANQIIVALNIEAVGEALLFASKAGADPAKVRQALMGGFAVVADPGSARRADDQADLRPGLPHRAAPEGPEPRAVARRGRSDCRCPTPRRRRSSSTPAPPHGGKAWDHSAMVKA
ncbi:MAG: NAD-binding protein, partial [Microthrixaceae bacterium]